METVVVLLAFIVTGIIGFIAVKKVDAFLEESRNEWEDCPETGEDDGRCLYG
ncbi:MAG: hypothetical protein ACI4AB_04220 [Acetatifactor sp.]